MCSRSAVNTGRPLIRRRATESAVSRIGNPNETTGMATAIMVGAFCAPCSARALSMNPMKRLPQSPRKIVEGYEFKKRKTEEGARHVKNEKKNQRGPPNKPTHKNHQKDKTREPRGPPTTEVTHQH